MNLRVENLQFGYSNDLVVENVNLEVKEGETLAVVGPNASGKTTLLKCINQILAPREGSVLVGGDEVSMLDREKVARKIGYVPQEMSEGFPMTIFDVILMGRKPHIDWKPTSKDIEIVTNTIEKLGFEDLAKRDVSELSGGQKQKVIVARALAQRPKILLLDEPTSNLDVKHQLEVLDIVKKQTESGLSVITALHDLNLAAKYCDRIVMLKNGEVYAEGGAEVLKPENIEPVFGIKATVVEKNGRKVIIPETSH